MKELEYRETNKLYFSSVESKRFKMNIYRGEFDNILIDNITLTVLKDNVDIAIIRLPSEKLSQISMLKRMCFPFLLTDTLVYYYSNLTLYNPNKLKNNNLIFIKCEPKHDNIINLLAEKIFNNYTSHYFSNPYLSREDILEGYKEWARSYISERNLNRISWLVMKDKRFIGFATCSFSPIKKIAEGVLYGVLLSESGKGIYGDIIRFTQKYFKDRKYLQMKVSTQVQNFAVQKVWNREGFVLKKSYNTIHINSFLRYSKIPSKVINLNISAKDVLRYGEVSGDFNPIHFKKKYAISKGLKDRIAHGLIVNSIISKYFGMEFPGNGTFFLDYTYKFFQPLYLNKNYKMVINFPFIKEKKGLFEAVIKILDKRGDICLLSYNNLLRK
ncbi:MAG: hypothetical protein KAT66_05965 [Candidatus Lokiarchaeota archaeon]|nr:hypothetical protein [Candidatus Lokiarchaeota archaeon]